MLLSRFVHFVKLIREPMPNIGAILKQEISRLARREIGGQVKATRKAVAQSRHAIAALKRQVAALERQVALLERRALDSVSAVPKGPAASVRFVARGLRAQRNRLGLSAADYGKLVGVSAQSIYNWEQQHAKPRAGQLAAIAGLRSIGKREARTQLERLTARTRQKARKN